MVTRAEQAEINAERNQMLAIEKMEAVGLFRLSLLLEGGMQDQALLRLVELLKADLASAAGDADTGSHAMQESGEQVPGNTEAPDARRAQIRDVTAALATTEGVVLGRIAAVQDQIELLERDLENEVQLARELNLSWRAIAKAARMNLSTTVRRFGSTGSDA